MINGRGALAGCLLLLAAAPAAAQILPAAVPRPDATGLLTRSDFSLTLSLLGTEDPRFFASGRVTGDIDVVDYGSGRANLTVDYEGVLGDERHPLALNHGNYILETSLSRRFGAVEVAGVFHHVSRHLVDRPRHESISWNVLGGRASRQWKVGSSTIDGRVGLGRVVQPHFVDYTWVADLGIAVRRPVTSRATVFAGGLGDLNRVTGERRGTGPCGARLEAGIRLRGVATSIELFGAYERRIDAYPTERSRVRFFEVGFRLFSS